MDERVLSAPGSSPRLVGEVLGQKMGKVSSVVSDQQIIYRLLTVIKVLNLV